MKTIRFFAVLLLGMVILSASARPASNNVAADPDENEIRQAMKTAVMEYNEECPTVIEDGLILASVIFKDSNIIMNFMVEVDDEQMEVLEEQKAELAQIMLEALVSDDNGFLALCKSTKTNIMERFTNKTGKKIEVLIPYTSM